MFDVLQGFVHELRAAGLPVSTTENLDAMRAVEHVGLEDRALLRSALGATLVKHRDHRPAFDTVFDVYFSLFSPVVAPDEGASGRAVERRHRRRLRRGWPRRPHARRAGRDADRGASHDGPRCACGDSRQRPSRRSRAWSPGAPWAGRTTCTEPCGSSTSTISVLGSARPTITTRRRSPIRSVRGSPKRSPRRGCACCAISSRRRSGAGWSPIVVSRRWRAPCASPCPRISTSCTPPAPRWWRSSARSTR